MGISHWLIFYNRMAVVLAEIQVTGLYHVIVSITAT